MIFGSNNGRQDDEYNAIGFVEIYKISVIQATFLFGTVYWYMRCFAVTLHFHFIQHSILLTFTFHYEKS